MLDNLLEFKSTRNCIKFTSKTCKNYDHKYHVECCSESKMNTMNVLIYFIRFRKCIWFTYLSKIDGELTRRNFASGSTSHQEKKILPLPTTESLKAELKWIERCYEKSVKTDLKDILWSFFRGAAMFVSFKIHGNMLVYMWNLCCKFTHVDTYNAVDAWTYFYRYIIKQNSLVLHWNGFDCTWTMIEIVCKCMQSLTDWCVNFRSLRLLQNTEGLLGHAYRISSLQCRAED
jgi:hypothetical protein